MASTSTTVNNGELSPHTNNELSPRASPTTSTTTATTNGHHSSSSSSSSSSSVFLHKPTLVEQAPLRFLIMDCPSANTLNSLVESLKKRNCVSVVRVCEPTYQTNLFASAGIQHIDLPFPDGDAPPAAVITSWMNLVHSTFDTPAASPSSSTPLEPPCIGVHCVAGLGRAPVLVAIALVEYGMMPMDAVHFIRKRRRGAINAKQLKFLESYQPVHQTQGCACNIM